MKEYMAKKAESDKMTNAGQSSEEEYIESKNNEDK